VDDNPLDHISASSNVVGCVVGIDMMEEKVRGKLPVYH
jgi:hypothetical protein